MDFSLKDILKSYKVEDLLSYLSCLNLQLERDDIVILRRERISGPNFFDLTKKDFRDIGIPLGPSTTLSSFIIRINSGKCYLSSLYIKLLYKILNVIF